MAMAQRARRAAEKAKAGNNGPARRWKKRFSAAARAALSAAAKARWKKAKAAGKSAL
jgi:hypothetical protein